MKPTSQKSKSFFRPCIDLHNGVVKQIVGGTLRDDNQDLQTNFESEKPASYFAELYKKNNLTGGHVIQLGAGNQDAATQALAAWPGGLQLGGGVTVANAKRWLDLGAAQVIVTSWLFQAGEIDWGRVREISEEIGPKNLVIDLSCRRHSQGNGPEWRVATNRWQTLTSVTISPSNLERFAGFCSEFLIHAADVEGLQQGIDKDLVSFLGDYSPIPCTYAGGARSVEDLQLVTDLGMGQVDLTIGSALDIFGGSGASFEDCVSWNKS